MQDSNASPRLIDEGQTFGVVGAGVMGQAILRGLLNSGTLRRDQVWACAKTEATCRRAAEALGIAVHRDYRPLVGHAGIIVLCVKPGQAPATVGGLQKAGVPPDTLLISILAGTTLHQLETWSCSQNPWVRAMPNTPCIVAEGVTVICPGTHAGGEHVVRARRVFEGVGTCVQADEVHFDAITALSGSGPAYQYLIMEALADAGVHVGLPRNLALQLVVQTMLGSAKMVQQSGRHPAALRDDVTTPAGCTIRGLLTLEDGKIRSVLAKAVEEATKVAGRLGAPTK